MYLPICSICLRCPWKLLQDSRLAQQGLTSATGGMCPGRRGEFTSRSQLWPASVTDFSMRIAALRLTLLYPPLERLAHVASPPLRLPIFPKCVLFFPVSISSSTVSSFVRSASYLYLCLFIFILFICFLPRLFENMSVCRLDTLSYFPLVSSQHVRSVFISLMYFVILVFLFKYACHWVYRSSQSSETDNVI